MGTEPGKSQRYPTYNSSSLTKPQNTSKIDNRLGSTNTSGPLLQPIINGAAHLFPWNLGDRDVELRSPSVDNYLDVPNLQSSAESRSSIVNDGDNAKYLEGIKATSNAKSNKNSRAEELSHVGAGIEDTTDHTEFNEAGFDRDTTLLEDKIETKNLRDQLTESDNLGACIRKALVKAIQQGDEKKFLPLDAQDRIITRNRVRQELSRHIAVSAAELEKLTDEVWEIKAPSSSKSPGKTTTRRRIFAILGLINKIEGILDFIQDGLYDSDLPFEFLDSPLPVLRLFRKAEGDNIDHICLFDKWKAHELESFNNYQWMFLSPYFKLSSEEDRKVRHYNLQNGTILPFMEDVELAGTVGGYGEFWRVKLHPAHHNCCEVTATPEENPFFAVKELRHGNPKAFDAEVSNLKRFSKSDHLHLIRLLVTFKWREKFYLLFPWADGNLLDFWQRFPQPLNPERNHNLALWFSEQCLGIAHGLKMIHTTDITIISTSGSLNPSKYSVHRSHGNLKPENILWFKSHDGGEDSWRGVLKISDLGLTRFHGTQSMSNFQTVGVSPTYRAPEYDIASKTSQSYDIWSLGCVLLEFVTWYLLGWEGVDQFSQRRSDNDTGVIREDKFFNLHGDLQRSAQVKISVLYEFNTLYNDEKCSDFIVDLLTLIEEKLLQIDPNNRVNCREIVENLDKLHSDSRKDRDYCTKRLKKAPNRTGTTLPELTAATLHHSDRAAEELAEMLLDNEELQKCVEIGFFEIDSALFERNFIRLLKSYASGLQADENTSIQKSPTSIVHNYRAYIDKLIWRRVVGLDDEGLASIFNSIKDETAMGLALERFSAQSRPARISDQVAAKLYDEQEKNGTNQSDGEELSDFEKPTDFLVLSSALKIFRVRLEALVTVNPRLQQEVLHSHEKINPTQGEINTLGSNSTKDTFERGQSDFWSIPAQTDITSNPDDTATNYSAESSVDIGDSIHDLVRDLFDKAHFKDFDPQTMDRVFESLPDLLKSFALKIGHDTDNLTHRYIMCFVHKHRGEVIKYLKDLFSSKEDTVPEAQVSYVDRRGYTIAWVRGSTERPMHVPYWEEEVDPESHNPPLDFQEADSEEEDNSLKPHLKYQDFICNAPAYDWLIFSLLREHLLLQSKQNQMDAIKQKIIKPLPSSRNISRSRPAQAYVTTFEVIWDPITFVKEQKYEGEPDEAIEIALTLTGTANGAQALPCKLYLKQVWGASGEHVILLVKDVVRSEHSRCTRVLPDRTKLTAWMEKSKFMLEAYGTRESVAEIGQQIAWLGAALRSSPYDIGVGYCTPSILYLPQTGPPRNSVHIARYKITFQVEKLLIHGNGQCWRNMFRNPLAVKGYPILRRDDPELGLETPLNVIAALSQTKKIDVFDGKLFIKGFSTMLVPTKRTGDLLIWHYLFQKDGSRISYLDADIPHVENISISTLVQVRHVVGWHPEVKFYAGAVDANYDVKPSFLPGPHAGCVLEKVSISGGKFITAAVSVGIGVRDKPLHLSRDAYVDKLKWAHKKYVVFWDQGEKRGWLVNGTSALLHLLRASLRIDAMDPFDFALMCNHEDLKEASISHATVSAIRVLMDQRNKDLPIYVDKVDTYEEETTNINNDLPSGVPEKVTKKKTTYVRVSDRIERLYNVMEKIIDHQIEIEGRGGVNMKFRIRKNLEGWDFNDVAAGNDPYESRVALLQTTGKGWVDFTRDIRAITLFGRDFGEIIKPTNPTSCPRWGTLPEGGYYLAACVPDLQQIMIDHKGDVAAIPRKLTRDTIWYSPYPAFEPCKCKGQISSEHSEFAQVPIPSHLHGKFFRNSATTTLHGGGAVVFGHNKTCAIFFPDQGDPIKEQSLRTITETKNQFHDSGIGSSQSSSTTTESEPATSIAQQLSHDSLGSRMSSQTSPLSVAQNAWGVLQVSSTKKHAVQPGRDTPVVAVGEDLATLSAPQYSSDTLAGRQSSQGPSSVRMPVQSILPVKSLPEPENAASSYPKQPPFTRLKRLAHWIRSPFSKQ